MKWFVKGGFGLVGCEFTEIIEESTEELAEDTARSLAIENAEIYGFYQDPVHFGIDDYVGREFDEETDEYEEEGELEYTVERYVPEEHDDFLL